MASPNIYTGGIGGSAGSTLATATRFIASGDVWYVSSSSGSDAASPRGRDRARPLATLAQAYTNAAAGDTIVLLSGHTETLSASQTLGKAGLNIIGEGAGSNRPHFTSNAAMVMFDVTAAGVFIDNIWFSASTTAAPSTARVKVTATAFWMANCYFECGTLDTVCSLEFATGAGQARVEDTTFISTSTSAASQPESAIKVTNAMSDLWLEGVTLNGGSSGWSNPFALNGAAAITRIKAIDLRCLNDSDITFATGTTGYVAERDPSGSVRIVWTA